MSVLSITAFSGMQPRTSARLLGNSNAQTASNVKLASGALVPFYAPKQVAAWPDLDIESVFRLTLSDGTDVWLAWGTDVDCAPGPVADDQYERYYYTGQNEPRVTTSDMAIDGAEPYPAKCYVLGVFPPANAPTLTTDTPSWTFTGYTYDSDAKTITLTGLSSTSGLDLGAVGDGVTMEDFVPAAWNDNFKISAVGDDGSVTLKADSGTISSDPGAVTTAGTVHRSYETLETRAAVYTLVTEWGEESSPSPAVIAEGYDVDTWTFSGFDPLPGNTYTATGASWASGVMTLTGITTTFGLRAGETVVLAGWVPEAINGTYKVTAKADDSLSFVLDADPGTVTTVGTITRDAPHHTSGMVRRFYMTFGDTASYLFLGDVAAEETSAVFDNPTSGDAIPTVYYDMPPADMQCLRMMSNGICVGLSGKDICFSEAYLPHAWPPDYRQTIDRQTVACDVVGTTVIIGTDGKPYAITGVDASTMGGGATAGAQVLPCLAQRGMCVAAYSMSQETYGAVYPSNDGFVVSTGSYFELLVPDILTRTEMSKLNPASMKAAMYGNAYVAFYDTDTGRRALMIDRTESWRMTLLDIDGEFPYVDPRNGNLYYYANHKLYQLEGDTSARMTMDWKSKKFVLPRPTIWNCAQVRFDATMTQAEIDAAKAAMQAIIDANQGMIEDGGTLGAWGMGVIGEYVWGGDAMSVIPEATWNTVILQVIVDGTIKTAVEVTSEKPFRLPTGFRSDVYELRLQGNIIIHAVHLATSMQELRGVS